MQVEPEPLDGMQKTRLSRAVSVTIEQIQQAREILQASGLKDLQDDPQLLSAILAAIATNYLAEVHSGTLSSS